MRVTSVRECDYGDLNGAPVEKLDSRRRLVDRPYPGGESYRNCIERMRSFLADVACEFEGRRVLVIAHSAQRWALRSLLERLPLEYFVDAPLRGGRDGSTSSSDTSWHDVTSQLSLLVIEQR